MSNHITFFNEVVSSCLQLAPRICTNHLSHNCVFIKDYLLTNNDQKRLEYEYECLCTNKVYSTDDIVEDIVSFSQKGQYVKQIILTLYFSTQEKTVIVVDLFLVDEETSVKDYKLNVYKTVDNWSEERIDINDYVNDIYRGRIHLSGVEGLRPY